MSSTARSCASVPRSVDGSRIANSYRRRSCRRALPRMCCPRVHGLRRTIDLQVNGGGDVLFNDQPTAQGIRTIAAAHRRFERRACCPRWSPTARRRPDWHWTRPTRSRRRAGILGSTSKGRICLPTSRACMTRGRSASRSGRSRAADCAAQRDTARDPGAGNGAGRLHRAASGPAFACRSVIRWQRTGRRRWPWRKG